VKEGPAKPSGSAPAPQGPSKPSTPSTPGAPTPGAGAAPAPSGGPKSEIVLGSIGSQTGVAGEITLLTPQGARAWVADVNARGGLAGHPVRLVLADDGGDPAKALALARRMVDQDKIVAFFAWHSFLTFQAVRPFLEEKQIPVIGGCQCHIGLAQSPMSFMVGTQTDMGLVWAHILQINAFSKPNESHKVSIIYCREAGETCGPLRDGIKKVAKQINLDIVHEAQSSIAQPDYTGEMLAARNAGADTIVAIMDNASGIRMARSAHRQGYRPNFSLQYQSHDERFLKSGGDEIDGFLVSGATVHYDSPLMADYRAALKKYVPGGVAGSFGEAPWLAGKVLEVIAKGFPPNPTTQDFLKGLYALNGETLGGAIPPLTFKQGVGHDDSDHCIIPFKVQSSKFVPKDGDNFTCPPGWKPVQK
jgi:branched-chain amino acid transport system substrate-binding protein